MSAAKPLLTVATLALLGTGGYAYWTRTLLRTSQDVVAQQHSDLTRATDDAASCKRDRDADRASAAQVASNLKVSQGELDALRAERAETEKQLTAFRALTASFQKMIDSGKLQVTMRHGRMIVKLPAEILFASGSADISKGGENALAEVAGILKQMPERRFMIAGHTDNVPVGPPSPFKNNLQLSTARAERVTETLITAGMNPAHLSAAGYSEYEPARENSTEAGRRENRRIEIVLLPNLAEIPVPADLAPRAAPSASSVAQAPSASASASGGPPSVH
ncbi:MAG: flagellar motor protein MotB [Polyangiaceae bacterium]